MNLSEFRVIVEDTGAWLAVVNGVAKSQIQLSNWTTPTTATKKLTALYPGATAAFWSDLHSVCRGCFSLNNFTPYLSLCLSLNSFRDETSRTWASLSPETSVISAKRSWFMLVNSRFLLENWIRFNMAPSFRSQVEFSTTHPAVISEAWPWHPGSGMDEAHLPAS